MEIGALIEKLERSVCDFAPSVANFNLYNCIATDRTDARKKNCKAVGVLLDRGVTENDGDDFLAHLFRHQK